MTLQESLLQLKKGFNETFDELTKADFENYQNNISDGCYDDTKVRNLLSNLYNAVADVENYVNVNVKKLK